MLWFTREMSAMPRSTLTHGGPRRFPWTFAPLLVAALLVTRPWFATAQETPTATPPGVAQMLPSPSPLPDAAPRVGGPINVVASTGILADLVRQIGGERVEVRSLLPANADPHDFEPAPDDLVAVEDADLIVRHGLGLDTWLDRLLQSAGGDAPVIVATEGVTTLSSTEEGFAEGDPHVWFDPTRVATMVGTIAGILTQLDPEGGTSYQARQTVYQQDLNALDRAIMAAVATIPPERRKLVTSHDALGYFADHFGLTIVGTVIPSLETTTEPSAKETAELIDLIKREGVPAIFAENTASPRLVDELAAQAGVKVVDDLYSDNLGKAGSGADTYLAMMRTDTILIVEALR